MTQGEKAVFKVFKEPGKMCVYDYGIKKKHSTKSDDDHGGNLT